MNKGINRAKGNWLFFLGSDDYLYNQDVLSDVANTITQTDHVDLVYGNVQLNKPIGYHHQDLIYAGKFDSNKLLEKNLCHQSAFYHRSLFDRFGLFHTEYRIFADYDFNLRCFNKILSQYVDKIIANFNVGGQSKTQQNADTLFHEKFLENMALHYSYDHKDYFFNGRKRELFELLKKKLGSMDLKNTFKIGKILAYQYLGRKHKMQQQ